MTETRRATVYLDPELHRALKMKAAASERTISELVNDAVRESLREDAEDLAAFDARAAEPTVDFDTFVADLHQRGKL